MIGLNKGEMKIKKQINQFTNPMRVLATGNCYPLPRDSTSNPNWLSKHSPPNSSPPPPPIPLPMKPKSPNPMAYNHRRN